MSRADTLDILGRDAARNADDVEQSIPARFARIAAVHESRTVFYSGSWQATYGELNAAANRLSHVLLSRGGAPGDRVAVLMRHDTPQIAAVLAVLKAGRVAVALNPTDPPARLQQVLDDADPVLIVTDSFNGKVAECIARDSRGVVCFEDHTSGPAHDPELPIDPGALAFLIYTSGSTGRPKGVMQTHRSINDKVRRIGKGIGARTDDRISLLASLSGGNGMTTLWCALLNGTAICPFAPMEKGVIGLADWLRDCRITVYSSSASLFRHFVKTLDQEQRFPHVRLVRLGSEPATSHDFAAFQRHFSDQCVLMHSLSASETGNISHLHLTQNTRVAEGRLPIGKPPEGIEVLLLDDQGRPTPSGQAGRIVVKGRHLSPGYWRQEALTRDRFFAPQDGSDGVFFQSGDLGCRDANGILTFLGRKDDQVKIRGYRIELSEIEEALSRRPEVERAVVCARPGPGGHPQLMAYVVLRAGQICDANALRQTLRAALPIHMVPAGFVFLEHFPLTPHGKIDRQELQRISPAASTQPTELPETDTETLLAGLWETVFDRSPIGRQDDFFDLGGDSLVAAVVAARVHAAKGVELDLRVFVDHPRLADFARFVDVLHSAQRERTQPLVRAPRQGPQPLSYAQQRIWKYSRTPEEAAGYTVSYMHQFAGPLDVDILRQSMDCIVRRHEILRTTFEIIDGEPRQISHPPEPTILPLLDLTGAADAKERATQLLKEESRRPFDLSRGPLMRFILARIGPNEHWLLRISHHIITDTWSWKVYFRELAVFYEAILRGETPSLAESMPLQYGDYAAWQQRVLNQKGPVYQEAIEWWKKLLRKGPRPLKPPFCRARPLEDATPADGLIWWGLNRTVSRRLDQFGREEGATYYGLRLAAFVSLLAYQTGKRDLVLGTYVTNRNRVEVQEMFGFFSNLTTLRLNCDLRQTYRQWISVVRKMVAETQARAEIPYEQLVEELQRQRVKPPEVRLIFGISDHHAPVYFGDTKLTWIERRMESMPWGFTISFDQHNEETRCRASFDAHLYDPDLVRKMIDQYLRFLDVVSQNPDTPMAESHRRSER
jgi:amino acid adenylation domain-containing protein